MQLPHELKMQKGDQCDFSHMIEGPITDEEFEEYMWTQRLDNETAEFLRSQTDPEKRAIVYSGNLSNVKNQFHMVQSRSKMRIPGSSKQED